MTKTKILDDLDEDEGVDEDGTGQLLLLLLLVRATRLPITFL